jgi:hypothetical protein
MSDWFEINYLVASPGALALNKLCSGHIGVEIDESFKEGAIVPAAIPDDYSDSTPGQKRKDAGMKCFVIPLYKDGSKNTKGYVRVRYGPQMEAMKMSMAVKFWYWAGQKIAEKFDKVLGLSKGAPVDIYVSGTGLHPYPVDIKNGGLEGGRNISLAPMINDPVKIISHEMAHVMFGGINDRSNAFEETLAEFLSTLFVPDDYNIFSDMISIACKQSHRTMMGNAFLQYNRNQTSYALESFWHYISCRFGLRTLLDGIFKQYIFATPESTNNVWATLASYYNTSVKDLAVNYVIDTLTGAYFRDMGMRYKTACQLLKPFYDVNLVWRQFKSLNGYDITKSSNVFTSKIALEPLGFEVHSIPVLALRAGLSKVEKIELILNNKDEVWTMVLLRRAGKSYSLKRVDGYVVSLDTPQSFDGVGDASLLLAVIRSGPSDLKASAVKYNIRLS